MPEKFRIAGLVSASMALGAALTIAAGAFAQEGVSVAVREELRRFVEAFGVFKKGYVEPVDDKKLVSECISGMVSGVDPDSAYLDEESVRELTGRSGRSAGTGLELRSVGVLRVAGVIDDTPAKRAGIRTGDSILSIDGAAVSGMKFQDAVSKLRGDPNTKVAITIQHPEETRPVSMDVDRQLIRVRSVVSRRLESGIGYVRIAQFQEASPAMVVQQVNELLKQGPTRGLILDLRDNPGGLFSSAVGVAGVFLPSHSLVLSTEGRAEASKRRYLVVPEDYAPKDKQDFLRDLNPEALTVPLVVLVNGGSAAAAEIVAGALQDHKRATLVGARTIGRASVQTIVPLPGNTAMKLTSANWTTPNGRSPKGGLTPDIAVAEEAADGKDPSLARAVARLAGSSR